MTTPRFEDLGQGIYCIDALYTAPDIACCYLVDGGGEYALIETGTARSVPNILGSLAALSIDVEQVRYVIPTHVHLDHAGGTGALLNHFPQAEALIHPRGHRHLVDPTRLIESSIGVYGESVFRDLYGDIQPIDPARVHALADGASISLGRRKLTVLHTRGHAEHHACYFDGQSNGWFTGDMFGVSYRRQRHASGAFVMPATTPTQFDPDLYMASVDALAETRPKRMYLTHYGALDFHPDQAELLKSQLRRYADLGNNPQQDLERLTGDVLEVTKGALETLVSPEEARQEMQSLQMDARLNAQGIAWWSQHAQQAAG